MARARAALSKSSAKKGAKKFAVKKAKPKKRPWRLTSAKSEHGKASPEARAPANLTSFAILFIAANIDSKL